MTQAVDRFAETTLHEIYIDLWGLTPRWIAAVQNAVLDFARSGDGETAEAYTCPACMAVKFVSTERARAAGAKSVVRKLLNLAERTSLDPKTVDYW